MMRATQRTLCTLVIVSLMGLAAVQANPTPLSPMQQMFILKEMKPDVERVGVIWQDGAEAHDEMMPRIKRAAASAEVKLFVSYVESEKDVSGHYRELTRKHDIQVLWIVDDSGVLQSDVTRDYLVEQSTKNGIPILAPTEDWVQAGASLTLQKENEDIRIVLNEAAALATAIDVPAEYQDQALYLSKK